MCVCVFICEHRYLDRVADKVEAMGGIKYLVVTGENNAEGHEKWKKRFPGMIRIIHRNDITGYTQMMEEKLSDEGPWSLVVPEESGPKTGYVTGETARFDFNPEDATATGDPSVTLVYLPGQTVGSLGVLYSPTGEKGSEGKRVTALFSGGSVGFSLEDQRLDGFSKNPLGLGEQAASLRRLTKEDFQCILPGWGAPMQFSSADEKVSMLMEAADVLQESATGMPSLDELL
ncbi:unnamed protein product [Choristocarpus tenellus]